MNRRLFLSAISAGAMSSAFLRFARASEGDVDPVAAERKLATDALARAKERGKPLLVFVVPKDSHDWQRGSLLGSWLANADDALLADLALVEVVCVPISALEGASIRELASDGEPLMLLVETHESTPRAIAIEGIVPDDLQERATRSASRTTEIRGAIDVALRERHELVSKWLRDALKLEERLAQLAQQADAALTAAQREAVAKHRDDPSKLEADLVLRAAAVLRRQAKESDPASVPAVTSAIATAAAAVLKVAPPAGALWGTRTGCGTRLDDPVAQKKASEWAVKCGMGYVPALSARFLDFFTNRTQ